MKGMWKLFVLTHPEQRLVIVLVLLLVAGAWFKHHRDLKDALPPSTPTPSSSPQEAAVSKPPP
jgi:hypothetical protein